MPNTAADEAEAIAALASILRERGDEPDGLRLSRARGGDESIPLQWWDTHRRGKPFKVIVLSAKAGYNGHPNWHWTLWQSSQGSQWELMAEGKS